MLIYLVGTVKSINKETIYIETSSGLAFEVFVISPKNFNLNKSFQIYVSCHLKDDYISIYGFEKKEELKFFKLLNKVNGIGPKTSLQILRNIEIERLIFLIQNDRKDELSKISGIGNKSGKLIADLKNKVNTYESYNLPYEDVFNALLSLGYSSSSIIKIISTLEKGLDDSEAMRLTLIGLKNEQFK